MPQPKHTQGPWAVDESRYAGSINRLDPFRHIGMVSQYQMTKEDREENEANARLIAAAPDLLAAAVEVLKGLNDRIDWAVENRSPTPVFEGIAALHDAINKATE